MVLPRSLAIRLAASTQATVLRFPRNTTGFQNTANGVNTLYGNTTGFRNTANGYQALYGNTTGANNTPKVSKRSTITVVKQRRVRFDAGLNLSSGSAMSVSATIFWELLARVTPLGSEMFMRRSRRGEQFTSIRIIR